MQIETRQKVLEELFNSCLAIGESKGKDYSGEEDALANFKQNAEALGMTKYQTWAIYFKKHIDAITNSIKSNPENPQVESEPLSERIKDVIVYAGLLYCLLEEKVILDHSTDYAIKEINDLKYKEGQETKGTKSKKCDSNCSDTCGGCSCSNNCKDTEIYYRRKKDGALMCLEANIEHDIVYFNSDGEPFTFSNYPMSLKRLLKKQKNKL